LGGEEAAPSSEEMLGPFDGRRGNSFVKTETAGGKLFAPCRDDPLLRNRRRIMGGKKKVFQRSPSISARNEEEEAPLPFSRRGGKERTAAPNGEAAFSLQGEEVPSFSEKFFPFPLTQKWGGVFVPLYFIIPMGGRRRAKNRSEIK